MFKKLSVMMLGLALLTAGCTTETKYGQCVGIGGERDPALKYETDAGNIIGAVIFFETIIIPIYVGLKAVECPVARREIPRPAAPALQ